MLSESLKKNNTLTRLILGSCCIENDGLISLGQALMTNCSITELNMNSNEIFFKQK